MTHQISPSDLWMPLFGIDTPQAHAERLRGMLDNIPWGVTTELYGSPLALEMRVAEMRAELAELEAQIVRGETEELPGDPYIQLVAAIPAPAPGRKAYTGVRPESYRAVDSQEAPGGRNPGGGVHPVPSTWTTVSSWDMMPANG